MQLRFITQTFTSIMPHLHTLHIDWKWMTLHTSQRQSLTVASTQQ